LNILRTEIIKKVLRPSTNKIVIQTYTLIIGILLLAAKFLAYVVSNSNAILTDALESIINVLAGGFGLYSLFVASKPMDEDHPYGHGRVELISASIEGALIFAAGLIMVIKSIYNFFFPSELSHLDIGIILIAITGVVNFILGWYSKHSGAKYSSATLIASGEHLKTDAFSSFAIILGLGVVYFTEYYWLDNVISIAIGLFIIISGFKILQSSVEGIMDKADFILLGNIVDALNRNRKVTWIDIHNLRIIKYGENIHIDCHATLPWYFNTHEAHEELKSVEAAIKEAIPNNLESFIHADPCLPQSCSICAVENCPKRMEIFEKKIEWNLDNVIKNQKHFL
jgi:cation diffusion facilitator family transporter